MPSQPLGIIARLHHSANAAKKRCAQREERERQEQLQRYIFDVLVYHSPNDLQELPALLATGVELNIYDRNGRTPLLLAVEKGLIHIAQLFLTHGADVNMPHEFTRETALHTAARTHQVVMVELLLTNKNINANDVSRIGETPLLSLMWHTSSENHKSAQKIMTILLQAGARRDKEQIIQQWMLQNAWDLKTCYYKAT